MAVSLHDHFPKYLYTERLTLELFDRSPAHFECILGAMNTPTAHARMGDYGIRTPAELDAFDATVRVRSPQYPDEKVDGDIYYLLRLRSEGASSPLMGGVLMAQREFSTEGATGKVLLPPDIGWALLEPYMGYGFATEAARELLRMITQDLGMPGVVVTHGGTNVQSGRVAEKLGCVPVGETKSLDHPGSTYKLWSTPGMHGVDQLIKNGMSFE